MGVADEHPPGRDWLAILSRPTLAEFASAFAESAVLEASVLAAPIIGAAGIRAFFAATRAMYDQIQFTSEYRAAGRTWLEWKGEYLSLSVAGETILATGTDGAIACVRIFHMPLKHSMQMTGNTIFITGGGSGIGRGLAEAFHRLGNKVIISGRRAERLKSTADANPGMVAVELDVSDPASITRVAADLIVQHPSLNVLINNAGIMLLDNVGGAIDEHLLVSTVTTNFGGPIRLSAALIDHLKVQANPVIVNVTSVLGFVPLVPTAIYSAMKAALHSYTLSQRYALRSEGVQVIELAPPWVRTELLNSTEEERAMPLAPFIEGVMAQFADGSDEILVGEAVSMRANPGAGEHGWVTEFNNLMTGGPALG